MLNLCRVEYWLKWIVSSALILGVLLLVGCERADRVAVAESSEATDGAGASKKSRKGMYSARIEQDSIVVGQPVEVAMAIEPGNDLKINLDFPWKLELQEMEGVSFSTSSFGMSEITLNEERATIPLVLNVAKSGEYDVEAIADFSVCNDDRCEILRGESVVVKVRGVEQAVE